MEGRVKLTPDRLRSIANIFRERSAFIKDIARHNMLMSGDFARAFSPSFLVANGLNLYDSIFNRNDRNRGWTDFSSQTTNCFSSQGSMSMVCLD